MVLFLALLVSAWADDPAPAEPVPDPAPTEEPAPEPPPVEEPAPAPAPEDPAPADVVEAEEVPTKPTGWHKVGWGFVPIPAVNYNTDEGFGFGAIGSLYRFDGKTSPYKSSFTLQIFMSTKAVHSHKFDVDLLEVGGTPLRLQARVMLDATKTANFCGYGWEEATCDPDAAEAAADDLGLVEGSEEREDFVRHYYFLRWIRPYGYLVGRYRVYDGPPKVEVFAGWRGEMFIPGSFKSTEKGPYPGSYYDDTVGAEEGFTSVFQVGANVDTRDYEPAPQRGQWHEISLRGTLPFTPVAKFFGFNTTFRFYAPLAPHLVLASRTVFDGLVGHAHVRELASMGGLKNYSFGGGDSAGRGIRLRRYIGKVKAMEQLELRWGFVRFAIAKGFRVELGLLAFADVLVAAKEWSDIGPAFAHPLPGEGLGLRIAINESFIIRADVGVSHLEGWSPGVYIDIDHLF